MAQQTKYDRARNVLTVPHGLMATMVESDVEEPVLALPLSAALMRRLLPQPEGPYSWKVYLHDRYNNWQLFYVFWTMTHCGDPQRADLVNAVLRNSVRFTRSFDCGLRDAMYQRRKCNFWVYW
ncbi:hypothetical protein HPB49_008852 [Dermacentor silvarum]|uniref:Uncharacterized protein n=1 Tax=Dermacentor silvarum TaxID=543639 RepID=A0ACB8C8J8_DERSI|nr:hypothetical protein HPB49_008852 [Dermacentor silvarum]